MLIRKATLQDCRAIAELALIAGEGIPGYFWEQNRSGGQDIIEVGAKSAASETDNFSYRNVHVAEKDKKVAGMLLAYRIDENIVNDSLDDYPEFIRPLIELEQCVPGSFYINMIATFPEFRNQSVGSGLMGMVDNLALQNGCTLSSVEVFEENTGAFRLYQRLGYRIIERRPVIPHSCHPYQGDVVLLGRSVS